MTGDELKACRRALGLGTGRFARLVGASDDRIVRRWEHGDYPVPRSVEIIATLAMRVPAARAWLLKRIDDT